MYTPAVLTPMTGIKGRSSGQAAKLVKRSRRPFALLKSRSRWVLSFDSTHTLPTPNWQSRVKALLAMGSSDHGPKMALIKFWSQSRVSVQQVYMWLPLWMTTQALKDDLYSGHDDHGMVDRSINIIGLLAVCDIFTLRRWLEPILSCIHATDWLHVI